MKTKEQALTPERFAEHAVYIFGAHVAWLTFDEIASEIDDYEEGETKEYRTESMLWIRRKLEDVADFLEV